MSCDDHIKMHEQSLIAENDLDADPEDLEMWQDPARPTSERPSPGTADSAGQTFVTSRL